MAIFGRSYPMRSAVIIRTNTVAPSGGGPTLKLFRNSNLSGLGAGGAFFVDMLGLILVMMLI